MIAEGRVEVGGLYKLVLLSLYSTSRGGRRGQGSVENTRVHV